MFNWNCYENISNLESFLYGGPESVEKNFEREESFSVPHVVGRNLDLGAKRSTTDPKDVWYELRYDDSTGKIVRVLLDDNGE